MSRIVVKLSGSLFDREAGPRAFTPFVRLFRNVIEGGVQLVLVAGGGRAARRYIDLARRLGGDEATLDAIGIEVARLNARLLVTALGESAHPAVPKDLDETAHAVLAGRIVVVGGFHPGHSTNAVAALVAERIRAGLLVNGTDVNGVYTADPRTHRDATRLRRVTTKELGRILGETSVHAGSYELMDPLALRIISRSRIKARIVKCDAKSIGAAIHGRPVGTLILP